MIEPEKTIKEEDDLLDQNLIADDSIEDTVEEDTLDMMFPNREDDNDDDGFDVNDFFDEND